MDAALRQLESIEACARVDVGATVVPPLLPLLHVEEGALHAPPTARDH